MPAGIVLSPSFVALSLLQLSPVLTTPRVLRRSRLKANSNNYQTSSRRYNKALISSKV